MVNTIILHFRIMSALVNVKHFFQSLVKLNPLLILDPDSNVHYWRKKHCDCNKLLGVKHPVASCERWSCEGQSAGEVARVNRCHQSHNVNTDGDWVSPLAHPLNTVKLPQKLLGTGVHRNHQPHDEPVCNVKLLNVPHVWSTNYVLIYMPYKTGPASQKIQRGPS